MPKSIKFCQWGVQFQSCCGFSLLLFFCLFLFVFTEWRGVHYSIPLRFSQGSKIVSEHDQEIPKSQTADKPLAQRPTYSFVMIIFQINWQKCSLGTLSCLQWLTYFLIVKHNISFKALLQQGILEPVFYGDLVK